ncbi:beta strand repeat-containing protein [Tahibacter harae]|uniref:Ig-like domain-containing protein n=1 Tax=Tahibacter harae TaxID=2963937 RepID=A0ABT1QUW1_9GAMM|nr:Ig-like domain-containing protein [Tahibacter harae]MCQ4166074.1 Ig-like domain-containing protein [Tahibacter harae]
MRIRKAAWAVVVFLLALCAVNAASAQTYSYHIYVDGDLNPGTGCTVPAIAGADSRLEVDVTGGTAPQVVAVRRAPCQSGSTFGPGTAVGGGYPVGLNNGTSGADVVELADAMASLQLGNSRGLRLAVVAQSASGTDELNAAAGGGPIILGLPAMPVPFLSWPLLFVLLGLIAFYGARRARRTAAWRALSLFFVACGIAIAANFAADGQVGDWSGTPPLAGDPAGDATSGESAIDMVNLFGAIENGRVFLRIDVRDLQNNPPVVSTPAVTTLEETPVTLTLTGTDVEGDPITFAIATPPARGTLGAITPVNATTATVVYTPTANLNGADSFTFTGSDGQGASAPATAAITVTPVNDPPSFTAGADQAVPENAGAQTVNAWATAISAGPADEAAQTVAFTASVVSTTGNLTFAAAPAVAANGTLTFTATNGTSGIATVSVVAQDNGGTANGGIDTSAAQTFVINVNAINHAPSFTAGANQTSLEDAGAQTVNAWASAISDGDGNTQVVDFQITGNTNPALFATAPAVSPTGVLTYTAAPNANGTASISVVLHDNGGTAFGGSDTSAPQTFTITVTAVNDAPSFTVGPNQTVFENASAQSVNPWATAISPGPADEAAQTLAFAVTNNTNPALFSAAPAISPTGALTYTPAAGVSGTATITLQLADNGGVANGGADTSATQTFTITVQGINHAPSFTVGPNQTSLEDAGPQTVNPWATAISDGDGNTQALDFQVTANSNPALFATAPAVSPTGALSYTAAPNANGTATITLLLHDNGGTGNGGIDASATQTFTITVTAVNDAPSFSGGTSASVLESAGPQTFANFHTAISAGPADEAGQTLSFTTTVTATTGSLAFSAAPAVAPNGTLTFTAQNGTFGTATVSSTLQDNGGTANSGQDTSAAQTFTITVNNVNDPPVFTVGGAQTVLEDAGAQTAAGFVTGIADGDDGSQTVSFTVTGNSNPALFSAGPAIAGDGTLTYTPAANANGSATITVIAQDNGGTGNGGNDTSAPQNFTINVTAVNDAPSFTGGTAASALESAGPQTFANFHTAISAGPADEAGQTLSFTTAVTATTGSLAFSAAPAVAPNGTLTFTAQNGTFGTATVSSTLQDNGGTANSGQDTSAAQTFTITVNNVNDPPVFTVGGAQTVLEDAGAQTAAGFVTGIADGDDGSQTVSFTVTGNSNPALFSAGPAIAGDGTLTYTPAANANGSATITVIAQDNGGTGSGGNDTSAPQNFTINVTAVNDAPSFTAGADPVVNEDSGPASIAWATAISSGPADESGQSFGFNVAVVSGGPLFSSLPTVSVAGQLNFTPAANASGTAVFTVTLQDNGGTANSGADTSAPATLTITINADDDPPAAVNDAATVTEDAAATAVNVLANDTDIDAGPISVASVTQPLNGSVVITGGGTGLTYQPNPNYCNAPPGTTPDTFTYTLAPGGSTATVLMTVTCVDDAPTAVNDSATITEDDPATAIPVLVNDTDPDGGPITITAITQPANGVVAITGGGSGLTYQPNANYCNAPTPGTPDTFTYTLTPGGSSATVSVAVTCVVDPPVAVADAATVAEDAAATPIDVLANDSNPDGSPLAVASVTQPANGTVVITGGGTGLSYQPNPNYCNTPPGTTLDTFTYTLNPAGPTPTATVTVSVTCVDDAPVAVNDTATMLEDAAATAIPVLANDTDVDGGPKAVASVTQPANGTVVITGGGTGLTYQPNPNYCNTQIGGTPDTFTYTLNPAGATPTATVSVTVTCVNDPPVVVAPAALPVHTNIAVGINDGAAGDLLVLANITDPDSSNFTIGTSPTVSVNGGDVAISANGAYTYNPPSGFTGTDTFQYTICDDGSPVACSANITVSLTVSGPRIFFVDDDAVVIGTRDGTLLQPLQTLSAAATVATSSGDKIFVFSGNYTTGITLANGVELAGHGLDAATVNDFDAELGITPPSYSIARPLVDQTPPVITNAAGNGITLGSNNTVRGVQIGNVTGGAIAGTGFGTLTVYDDVRINTNGQALNLTNGTFAAGSIVAALSSSGGANNVSLTTVNGTVDLGTGALSGATGTSFNVSGGTVAVTYAGSMSKTSAGLLIDVQNKASGNITLSGALSATNGTGINLSNVDSNFTASGVVTLNGGDAGIDITTNSAGTINFSNTGSAITNPTNEAIRIDSSSPTFTYAGTISKNNTGTGIRLSNNTGGTQSYTGAITLSSAAANAIDLSTNGASTMNFSGAVGLTTTLGDGVRHQTSGTVNFSGGLTITSASGDGIDATGGGTLTVTAGGAIVNTISTTGTGTSLNVNTTQIGSGGLTFRSITNNGTGANGISLVNTGTGAGNGGLTITGVGTTTNSGGTINNKTARGVSTNGLKSLTLSNMGFTGNGTNQDGAATCGNAFGGTNTNCGAAIHMVATSAVALSNVDVSGGTQMGINGNDVNGLTMDDVTVANVGDENLEDGVQFVNLRGTVNISNSSFTGNYHRQFEVQNPNATSALTMAITNSTFDRGIYTSTAAQGVLIAGHGTSQMTTAINGSTFRRNFGTALTAQGIGNANMTFNVGTTVANTFTDNSLALQFLTDNAATMNATAQNNTITVSGTVTSGNTPVTFRKGTGATGLFVGTFSNNTIGGAAVDSGNNCAGCNGVSVTNEGTGGDMRMTISNNTVQHIRQRAVEVISQLNDTIGVVITNNQFLSPDPPVPAGTRVGHAVFVQSGNDDGDSSQLCADIQGNNIAGTWDGSVAAGNMRMRINPAETGTAPLANFRLRNLGGTGTITDVVNYLNGANTNAQPTATTNSFTSYTTGTAPCF